MGEDDLRDELIELQKNLMEEMERRFKVESSMLALTAYIEGYFSNSENSVTVFATQMKERISNAAK